MKYKSNILIIVLLAVCSLAARADASFSLVPPRTVVEGNKFTITFRLSNANASAPRAPELGNCKFLYGPSTSTMSSTQIINGQMSTSSSIDYTFTYLAEKAGEVTIPPVTIVASGRELTSRQHTLTILPPDQRGGSSQAGGSRPAAAVQDREFSSDDMFVRISLNKSSVYEQEPVVADVKVYTRYEISSFQISAQPTFEGFLSEELEVPSGMQMEHYNGKNYYTAYLKRCILYPQKPGKLTITSGKYDVTIVDYELVSNGFFQTRRPVEKRVVTQSNNASVNVSALPEPKPESFTGAVGSFTAKAEVTPLELRTNEAASYNLTIQGTGNIKYLKTPTLLLPNGIDQFTPKTDISASFTGNDMRGTFKVNYTLVPQDPGTFEIPSHAFSYFNPADKKYHTIDLPAFEIKVAQGATVSTATEQKSIAKGVTDILHIKSADGTLSHARHYAFRSSGYWTLYVIAALALVAVAIAYRRRLKLNADVKGRKLAKANKQAAKRLKAAKAAMAAGESDRFYAALNQAMWGYLGDKLGIPSSQLVRDNISAQLATYGLSQDAIDQTIDILDQCEMARFTPQHSADEMSSLLDKAATAIKTIENTKK